MNGSSLLPATLAGLLFLALPVSASDREQAKLLADDLRFAESLAVSRYFELANDVVTDTMSTIAGLRTEDASLEGDASLVKARIAVRRSEATADAVLRLTSLSNAIDELRNWSKPGSTYAYLNRMTDALEDLAKALGERGKEYTIQVAAGNEAAIASANADFKEADGVYRELRKQALKHASQLEGEEKIDDAMSMQSKAALTYYLRGLNSVNWADVASDREFRLEQAIEMVDEFLWEVGEDSLVYYSATYEMARAYAKLGELDDARELLENVLELGLPFFWEDKEQNIVIITNDQFSPAMRQIIGALFDSVWGYLALLDADAGNLSAASDRIDAMLAEHAEKQVPMRREGHEVLLTWAKKLSDLGKTDEASQLALRVAEEGDGTPAGGRAKVFLSSLITSGSVVIDSPDALMSAADGFNKEKNYSQAAFYFERTASTADTPELRRTYAFEAWINAGRALRNQSRHLEAAVAFEQALDTATELFPDQVDKQELAAERFYQSYASRYAETQSPFDKQLRDKASQRILDLGLELDVQFTKALEAFRDLPPDDTQRPLIVFEEFEAVPESSTNYERALVYAARCLEAAGQLEEAHKRFTQIEDRATDPKLEPTNDAQRNKREIALAEARYFHAQLLLEDSVNKPEEALKILDNFESEAPGQVSFHPRVKWQRVMAHAKANQVEEAESALEVLRESPGVQPTFITSAAYRVATTLKAESDRLEVEDAGRSNELLRRAAQALEVYAEADGFSSFRNLLTIGEWYLAAGDNTDALRLFEKAEQVHGDNPDVTEQSMDSARIGQARSLDVGLDFARSRPIWMDLLNRNPSKFSIKRGAARSLGGWLQIQDDGSIVEIAGAGDYDMAHNIWAELFKSTKGNGRYSQLYWESKLGSLDTWYRQRAADPEKARQARTVLSQLQLFQPNYDKDTVDVLEPELRYEPLYAPYFRYLDKRLPTD
jgi:tetratricopeptide (TPR) repeat protein